MREFIIYLSMIALLFVPQLTYANTPESLEIHQPSDWAVQEMYEANAAGILPLDWRTTLHSPITPQHSSYIKTGLERKFELSGIEKVTQTLQAGPSTRGEVLRFYYTIIMDHKIDAMGNTEDYLTYMRHAGIITGDPEANLRLDDPCTLQEAVVFANRVLNHVYNVTDNGAKGLLWKVSDGDNTVYLLGTIHLGKEKNYPFHETLNKGIESVDQIAFEADFYDQQGLAYLQQKQLYLDGTRLKEYISPELYVEVVQASALFNLTESDIQYIKPWALANMFVSLANTDRAAGQLEEQQLVPIIDLYVYDKAILAGTEIIELEGFKYQADLFDSIPLETQIQSLEESIDLVLTPENDVQAAQTAQDSIDMVEEWLACFYEGDEARFAVAYPKDALLEAESEMAQVLFDKRDDNMTQMVLKYLDDTDKDYMVVVGAAHMIGQSGIVQQLIDYGYDVKSVE